MRENIEITKDSGLKIDNILFVLRTIEHQNLDASTTMSQVALVTGQSAVKLDHLDNNMRYRFEAVDRGISLGHTQNTSILQSVEILETKANDVESLVERGLNFQKQSNERALELLANISDQIRQLNAGKAANYEVVFKSNTLTSRGMTA